MRVREAPVHSVCIKFDQSIEHKDFVKLSVLISESSAPTRRHHVPLQTGIVLLEVPG